MSSSQNGDDDSFIILGTSPGTSLDMKYNGIENGEVVLDTDQMEEAMKDLPPEANMAFKAHFKLGDCGPSPASMMVASTIISDDRSTEELQKRFGELLDENIILKETLKQNNESMKEQFLLIASCQEDMMKTHELHKEKFDETKGLVEKLRLENKKLKLDITRLADSEQPSVTSSETGERDPARSGASSALEFVTSPDDDIINKLTAQLELVEKQRRQVIVDNEKLTWQKESLEHIVDATSKERDDIKEKLKNAELQLSTKDTEFAAEISKFKYNIQELEAQIQLRNITAGVEAEQARSAQVVQLEARVSSLQAELKTAQLRILELEGVKLELSKQKSGTIEAVKIYKDQIQDLQNRLKEATTTVFQPVRFSISSEPDSSSSEYSSMTSNVKLYDRALKHLADLLNLLTHGMTDSLVQTLGLVTSLHEYKLDRSTAEQFKSSLAEVRQQINRQHNTALSNIGQVRSTITIFEGIFRDYTELLKKSVTKQPLERAANVDALTAALVARGQELQQLQDELQHLREKNDTSELMKAQLDLYKSDFEAERQSREKMASEKENILTDFRTTQRKNEELTKQLEEVRKLNPGIYQSAMSRASSSPRARPATRSPPSTTGNMVFTCPKCTRFSCDQYKVMEDHFDFCLDDF